MNNIIATLQKNGIIILGVGFILFLIIFTFFYHNEKNVINEQGNITIGKVYYSAWLVGQGQYLCKYIYYVDGNKYYGQEVHYNSKCYIGDFYKVKYLPKNPDVNRIDLSRKIPFNLLYQYFPSIQNPFEMDSTNNLKR